MSIEIRDKNGLTEEEYLASYSPKDYPRPSLTADIVVFLHINLGYKILLVKRGNHPCLGKWALPGGFAEKDEIIANTAARELEEETGLMGLTLIPVGLFSAPGRDPRGWTVTQAFASIIPAERMNEVRAGDDAAAAAWFDISVERDGQSVYIHFCSNEEAFSATIEETASGGFAEEGLKITDTGGIAFDHAGIILRAMEKAGI